jgi:hypothetical protein
MAEQVTDRAGKPVNTGDSATVVGIVTSTSGSGPTATVNISTSGSSTSIAVKASDVAATGQTL